MVPERAEVPVKSVSRVNAGHVRQSEISQVLELREDRFLQRISIYFSRYMFFGVLPGTFLFRGHLGDSTTGAWNGPLIMYKTDVPTLQRSSIELKFLTKYGEQINVSRGRC